MSPPLFIMKTKLDAKKERRLRIQLATAIMLVVFGCVLIAASFCVPPQGEIHSSVLTAFGEILTFAGAVIGIDYKYRENHADNS